MTPTVEVRPGDWDLPDTPSDRLARFTEPPPAPQPAPEPIEEIPTHFTVRIEGR